MTEPKLGVLIADHEGFFREAIRDALAEAGIESRTVSTGDEVLSASDDPAIGVRLGATVEARRVDSAREAACRDTAQPGCVSALSTVGGR